jgi:23S rRNA pseudouridine1911/1915/1917 synthase
VPEIRFSVAAESTERLDRFLADQLQLSRTQAARLVAAKAVTVNDAVARASRLLARRDAVIVRIPDDEPPRTLRPTPLDLVVVYEDEHLAIIDKPAGLVVHPAPGHASGTLVNALLGRGEDLAPGGIAGVQRPGIVHRLDRDTSGLLMVARSDLAQASLQAQLKARRIKKTYLALVAGSVAAGAGRIEAPIGRDPGRRTRMAVVPDGRQATTGYRVRERFAGWTLLELDLVTGRTHQIRVHLEAIGHPVAGDPIYGTGTSRRGPDGLERLFLHAWRLELTSPSSGRLLRAEAPLPPELEDVLAGLRAAGPGGRGSR